MLSIVILSLSWLVIYAMLSGVGMSLYALLRSSQIDVNDGLYSFWAGWAITITGLQIIHLFTPITALIATAICILSLWGWWTARSFVVQILSEVRHHKVLLGLFLLLTIWLTPTAIVGYYQYDDGLYHLQDVQWMRDYALVTGLGNLHGRFAFNTSHTLLTAFLDALPTIPPARHILHGTLLTGFIVQALVSLNRLCRTAHPRAHDAFYVMALPVTIFVSPAFLAAIKNDYAVLIVGLFIAGQILRIALERDPPALKTLIVLLWVVCMSVTIKLSMAIFAGALMLVLAWRNLRWTVIISFILVPLVVGVWMLRGVMLSGYPLYPLEVISFPVDWRIPSDLVIDEMNSVRAWARLPRVDPVLVLSSMDWIMPWWEENRRLRYEFLLPLAIGAGSLSLTILYFVLRRHMFALDKRYWFLPLAALVGLMYWFYSAPAVRFGWHIYWSLGLGLYITMLVAVGGLRRFPILLLMIPLLTYALFTARPRELPAAFPAPPETVYNQRVTDSGLVVNVPGRTDQCWLAPLPCTPRFNPQMQLRDADQIRRGFSIIDE